MIMGRVIGAVLAAGKGKRMQDPTRPKVLALLEGKPLLWYVLQALEPLNLERTIAIVGYQREQVIAYLAEHFPHVEYAVQAAQLGTGHAVLQLEESLRQWQGTLLIANGDVPLVESNTYQALLAQHHQTRATMTVLTTMVPSPDGYGRILREEDGTFCAIVEDADLEPNQRHITEINTGIYAAEVPLLFEVLRATSNANAQGEFYLTDAVGALRARGESVHAWCHPDWQQFLGVNTYQQLEELAALLSARRRSTSAEVQ
ncbi:Bifunctional protein GlmU [bacterium HR20]|uniref:UDP-N-acetylglucosamine pyrophosphorylase n=1 Tax=uncultured Bacteroidota bacterium TaxID=152509 RepID=H5SIM9_9BACT|nr:UDP-N-acetylglucosamine pyrophosphorylase [uncultured Bacteroidetes bacterium]GBD04893.1 Bifunctional protein GlmU [bacterium HR20]